MYDFLEGDSEYESNEVSGIRSASLSAGEVGGSWVLFNEMDGHNGVEPIGL